MQLIPTQEEVVALLKETGALREGFFEYPNGLYSNQCLQMALAFRQFQHQKLLSVGLSRKIRLDPEIRASISDLSIVAPATGGLPVAFGVCEALRAKQVYWAEKANKSDPLRFRQFLEQSKGEKILLVDDMLRTGQKMQHLINLAKENEAEVMGIGVVVYQPTPTTPSFSPLPLFYLAKLDSQYCTENEVCALTTEGMQPTKVRI
jgi:orotate phosphoribosyltransferase